VLEYYRDLAEQLAAMPGGHARLRQEYFATVTLPQPIHGLVSTSGAILEAWTLKEEGVRRWLAPVRWRTVGRELSLFADWHNGQRPHAGLGGATPDEVYFGRLPAHHGPRYEPRPRWPRDARCARPQAPVRGRPGVRLALEVRYLEGRAHLPVVSLTRAA